MMFQRVEPCRAVCPGVYYRQRFKGPVRQHLPVVCITVARKPYQVFIFHVVHGKGG